MNSPLVSVVMAMYNTRPYVAEAIESVLRQEYDNFELIVVDDGSTDGSREVAERFEDPRVRLIRTENCGLSAARNVGIAWSNGIYITFVDSDDILTPKSLSSRVDALRRYRVDCAFSKNLIAVDIYTDVNSIRLPYRHYDVALGHVWPAKELIDSLIKGRFFVFAQAFLAERRILQTIGGFDEDIKVAEDVEFITRLLPACNSIVETFETYYIHRRAPGSLSDVNSRRKADEVLRATRQAHRNLAPYLSGREAWIAQSLFRVCVQTYPHWTNNHRMAMVEAQRLRGDEPFDLSCVGGPRAQAAAHLLGWRAGRLSTVASSSLRRSLRRIRASLIQRKSPLSKYMYSSGRGAGSVAEVQGNAAGTATSLSREPPNERHVAQSLAGHSPPLVTVAVRACNSRPFIRAALDGAVAQTYRPLEVVICDDGSTDGTEAEIGAYLAEVSTDVPIRFVRHAINLGVGAALDTIVANSRGDYLMIADGDDVSLPDRAAECVDAVRRTGPDCLGVACQGRCIDPDGNELGGPILLHREADLTAASIARGGGLKGCMSLLSRRVFQAGPPLGGLRQQEDRLLGYRAACLGKLACLPRILMVRRMHAANTSGHPQGASSPMDTRTWLLHYLRHQIEASARLIHETDQLANTGLLSRPAAEEYLQILKRDRSTLRFYRAVMHRRRAVRIAALLALLRRGIAPRAIGRVYMHAHLPRVSALLLRRHAYYRRVSQALRATSP